MASKRIPSEYGNPGRGQSTWIRLRTEATDGGSAGNGTAASLLREKGGDTASKGTITPVRPVGQHRAGAGLKGLKG